LANVNTQNRSDARSAATGSKQGSDTGKTRPAPREEGAAGGTEPAAEQVVAPSAIVVIAPNPKRMNSIAYKHYGFYGPTGQMTDADACKSRGVRGKDLTWDAQRGHILVGQAAEAFPIDGSKEEQAQFLLLLSKNSDIEAEFRPHEYTDKELIKWGYMPAPTPEPTETEQKAKENA
jgi:hypothetical protein